MTSGWSKTQQEKSRLSSSSIFLSGKEINKQLQFENLWLGRYHHDLYWNVRRNVVWFHSEAVLKLSTFARVLWWMKKNLKTLSGTSRNNHARIRPSYVSVWEFTCGLRKPGGAPWPIICLKTLIFLSERKKFCCRIAWRLALLPNFGRNS